MIRILTWLLRAGLWLLRVTQSLRLRIGFVVAGDRQHRNCLNCGIFVEEEARTNRFDSRWLAWTATSEHRAACGLVCANGIAPETWAREKDKPPDERAIHNAASSTCACPPRIKMA